jgi:dTDP-4-amino-4,6-dideoxygalactose transaminase
MMEKVPFARLWDGIEPLYGEYIEKISALIKATHFVGGKEIEAFEASFAEYCGTQYSVGAANGTDAIIIALRALGIGPGDTVLVPVNTFIATSESVTMAGANVEFVDIEPDFYTMDPDRVEAFLQKDAGKKVKAIIPVHLYGQMADMPRLMAIARKYGLKVIEDSAQAHGSKLLGKGPGQYGDIATFSFYPGKNLGAFGDAGAMAMNDKALYEKCKALVNHGRYNAKYEHQMEGYNMRLDTIQAAVLSIKLKHLGEWTERRRLLARDYLAAMEGIEGIAAPSVRNGANPVWHLFVVRSDKRDALQKALAEKEIETGIHYPIPLHLQPAYAYKGIPRDDFPVAVKAAEEILSLPFWPEMERSQMDCVMTEIGRFIRG